MAQTSINMIAGDDARASDINKIVADIAEIYAGGPGVPVGGVIYWWSDNTVPLNYKVCDGTTLVDAASPLNGLVLPNLLDRFVRGTANTNLRSTPQSGGEDAHTLTWDEMPVHSHGVYDGTHSHGFPRDVVVTSGGGNSRAANSGGGQQFAWSQMGGTHASYANIGIYNAGSGWSHNNVPAYRGLVPIVRVK